MNTRVWNKTIKVVAFTLLTSVSCCVAVEEAPKFKFAPALEWLEALGFVKKAEVIKIAQDCIDQQQTFFMEEIKKLTDKLNELTSEKGLVLSKVEEQKLKFLLKQVVRYK